MPLRAFASLQQLVAWAKRAPRNCRVLGIEIGERAVSCAAPGVFGTPAAPTCFLPGNEGQGLLESQIALCDGLVYVPQCVRRADTMNRGAAAAATWLFL